MTCEGEGTAGAADHTGEMATGVREQGSMAFIAVHAREKGEAGLLGRVQGRTGSSAWWVSCEAGHALGLC